MIQGEKMRTNVQGKAHISRKLAGVLKYMESHAAMLLIKSLVLILGSTDWNLTNMSLT